MITKIAVVGAGTSARYGEFDIANEESDE
jgi:hypothetical protein